MVVGVGSMEKTRDLEMMKFAGAMENFFLLPSDFQSVEDFWLCLTFYLQQIIKFLECDRTCSLKVMVLKCSPE